ncbi:hypothetical protein D3C78_881440 [compost metagenome]
MLTAGLGLCGIVAQVAGGLAQSAGRGLQLADHQAQLGGEGVEVPCQLRDFIPAMGIEAACQVTFAAGNIGHGIHRFTKWANDAAGNQHDQQGHQHRDGQAHQRCLPDLAIELDLHVVDVHAGANDPTPGLEQFDVGSFLHRGAGAGLGPAVVDHAGALGLGDGHHLVEQRETVRVFDRGEVLAIKLRVGRVHDHDRGQVIDPEVVTLVVAQATYHAERLFLCGVAGEGAGFFQLMVVAEDPAGGLDHVLGLLGLGLIQVIVNLLEHQHTQG